MDCYIDIRTDHKTLFTDASWAQSDSLSIAKFKKKSNEKMCTCENFNFLLNECQDLLVYF